MLPCCSQFPPRCFDASSHFLLSRRPVPLFLIHIDRSASQNSSFTLFLIRRKILALHLGSRLRRPRTLVLARLLGKTSGRSELSLAAVKAVLSGLQRREAVVEEVYAGVSVLSVSEPGSRLWRLSFSFLPRSLKTSRISFSPLCAMSKRVLGAIRRWCRACFVL